MNEQKLAVSYILKKEWQSDISKRYHSVFFKQHDNQDYLITTFLIGDSYDANKVIDAIFWVAFNYGFSNGYDSCLAKIKEAV